MSKFYKHLGVFFVIALLVAACTPKATEAPTTAATQPPTTAATTAPVATTPPAATGSPAATPAGTTVPSTGGNIDCKGAASGDTISVVYEWSGNEQDQFNTVVKPLLDACGIQINAQTTRDPAVLDTLVKSTPPD